MAYTLKPVFCLGALALAGGTACRTSPNTIEPAEYKVYRAFLDQTDWIAPLPFLNTVISPPVTDKPKSQSGTSDTTASVLIFERTKRLISDDGASPGRATGEPIQQAGVQESIRVLLNAENVNDDQQQTKTAQELYLDFVAKNKLPHPLSGLKDLGGRFALVPLPGDNYTSRMDTFKNLRRNHPYMKKLLLMSRVAFNRDKTLGVLYVSDWLRIPGHGFYLLRRDGEEWRVTNWTGPPF